MRRPLRSRQQGFLVVTVVLVLAVLAAIALMLSTSTSLDNAVIAKHAERVTLDHVATSGMAHMTWQLAQNTSCTNYASLPATPFGPHSYSASLSPLGGSPVSIVAVGNLNSGAAYTVSRDDFKSYQASSTVFLQPGSEGVDAEIWDQAPDNNYGDSNQTWVSSALNDTTRSLLRFDVEGIPAAATVLSATLALDRQSGSGANQPVSAHRIKNQWSEAAVSWNSRETGTNWDTAGGDFDYVATATTPVGPADGLYEWDITALAQGWVDGSYPNYGVALVAAIAGMSGERFYTSDESDFSRRPSLSLTYACECGLGAAQIDVLQPDEITGKDSRIFEGQPGDNFGSVNVLRVVDSAGQVQRSLIAFDLSYIPAGSAIAVATLELEATTVPLPGTVSAHRITTEWLEMEATWADAASASSWISTGGDFDPVAADSQFVAGAGKYTFDLTSMVTDWVQNGVQNHGLLLREQSGIFANFGSSDIGDSEKRPKLTISYTCPCGATCVPGAGGGGGGAGNLLLVVDNPVSLSTQDTAKKALIESWGYIVTLIDDGDSPTAFNAAVATADVAYVSATVSDTSLNSKLAGALIGIVSEKSNLVEEFGFSSSQSGSNTMSVDITNNSHYITSEFSTGNLTLQNVPQPSYALAGTLAIELESLADGNGGSPGLAVLERGAILFGGGRAAGRLVKLPWGGAAFNHTLMNTDGETMMRRAIEWGATEPLACNADYIPTALVDEFSNAPYGGSKPASLAYIPVGTVFNGVAAPGGGAWILGNKTFDLLHMVDTTGTELTSIAIPVDLTAGLVFIDSGTWNNHFAYANQTNDSIDLLDLSGVIQGSFSTATYTTLPTGVGFINASASGTYDGHLVITSNQDATGLPAAAVYIVDQNGSLKLTINVGTSASSPIGVAHLPGTDRLLVADNLGLNIVTIGLDGTEYANYNAEALGAESIETFAINRLTCDHVIIDKKTEKTIYLNVAGSGGGGGGGGSPVVFGFDTEFASTQINVRRLQIATQVTLPEDGTVTSITAYVGGRDRNVRYAIYSDVAGEPGALQVESANILTANGMGWVNGNVPATALSAGTYWLALSFDDNLQKYAYQNGGQTRYSNNRATQSGFTNNWGPTTTSYPREISIYATYTP